MRISDWSSDVCSSDLMPVPGGIIGRIAFGQPIEIEIEIGAARKRRLVEETAPEGDVGTLAIPRHLVVEDAGLVTRQPIERQRIEGGEIGLVGTAEFGANTGEGKIGRAHV